MLFLTCACSVNRHSKKRHSPEKTLDRVVEVTPLPSQNSALHVGRLTTGQEILIRKSAENSDRSLFQLLVADEDWRNFKENRAQMLADIRSELSEKGIKILKEHADVGYFIVEGPLSIADLSLRFPVQTKLEFLTATPATQDAEVVSGHELDTSSLESDWNHLAGTGLKEFFAAAKTKFGEVPSGRGIKIGIVDSGISMGHPAFRDGKSDRTRIKKFFDSAFEGSVSFRNKQSTEAVKVSHGKYLLSGEFYDELTPFSFLLSPNLTLSSGIEVLLPDELAQQIEKEAAKIRLGWLDEGRFQSVENFLDLNGNRKINDRFLVIRYGHDEKDSVFYIDFEGSRDFRNQKGLRDYNQYGDTRRIGHERIGVVVDWSEGALGLEPEFSVMSLVGVDPSHHGTHVASIAAGSSFVRNLPTEKSPLRGLANEAEIYMARAIRANGQVWGDTEAILKLANEGVDWINLSYSGLASSNADGRPRTILPELLERLTLEKNVRFVIAAGNEGPGNFSLSSMAEGGEIVSVAALAHERLTRTSNDEEFAALPPSWFPLSFSSRGPSTSGAFHPQISAPGLMLAAAPMSVLAKDRSAFVSMKGTSMAAPFVTGALALLQDAQLRLQPAQAPNKKRLIEALNEGAETLRIPGTSWHDTGHGLIRLDKSFALLQKESHAKEIVEAVFAEDPNALSPQRPQLLRSLNLQLRSGEKICTNLWMHRQALESLPAQRRIDVQEELGTSLETYRIKVESFGMDPAIIELAGIEGRDPQFWKVLGFGADDVQINEGVFAPRPESRLQICFDETKNTAKTSGLIGFLLKFYRINHDSSDEDPLPAAEFPITLAVPSQLEDLKSGYTRKYQVPPSLGIRDNFQIPADALYAELQLSTPHQKTQCGSIEAMLLPPIKTAQRDDFLKAHTDVVNNCGPMPSIRFELYNPAAGLWSLGLRPRRGPETALPIHVRLNYYRGKWTAEEPYREASQKVFRWKLKSLASPLAKEDVESRWIFFGRERSESLNVAEDATQRSQPSFCFTPSEEVTTIKVDASRSAESAANPFLLELLECPAGITNPDDPGCFGLETLTSVGGAVSARRNASWGQNFCLRILSKKTVALHARIQELFSEKALPCSVESKTMDSSNEENLVAEHQIECRIDTDAMRSGSETGSSKLGRVEFLLKHGRRILNSEKISI